MAMGIMNGNEMQEGIKKSGKKVGIIVILVLILVVASMLFGRSCGKKAAQKQLDQKEEEVKTWQDLYYGELDEVNQARDDLSAAKEEIEKLKAGGAVSAQDTSADEAAAEVTADDGAVDATVDAGEDAAGDAAADASGDSVSDASGDAASEEAGDEKNATGISPDLKAFLDSYENYMDEYVEFLKKYNSDSANALTMIGEYTQMLAKYEDFADKADKYNEDNLNAEEWKYYMEVINRVNQKLMSVY